MQVDFLDPSKIIDNPVDPDDVHFIYLYYQLGAIGILNENRHISQMGGERT